MSDRSIELTRRRLLGGVLTVAGASAATGAGTMAYFSDSESSSGNQVEAGTLSLDFGGSASFNFSTSLAPTESTTGSVTLTSTGSLTGSVDVDVSYTENDASGNGTDVSAQQVAENLLVQTLTYGSTDLLAGGQGLSGTPTLHELSTNDQSSGESTPNDLVDLADPGGGTTFTVELELDNVDNDFQSDGVDVTFTFDLNQTDGQ